MLVTQKRPRDLHWFHAGPLLFGDWGTSRLYVLGLAFYYTAHASVLYLGVMSLIMIVVAWAYTVVCRCFPEGGGVYTAARQLSPTLSVIGATLLLCDYIVTAALSAVEAFHYMGVPHALTVYLCLVTIVGIGLINWLGARSAGRLALGIAVLSLGASFVIGLMCIPLLPKGLSTVTTGHGSIGTPWQMWESLVRIVLALSGVEAVANMTGLMKEPVARTARRTIWPVLIEVIALNMIFGIALNALPALSDVSTPSYVVHEVRGGLSPESVPEDVKAYRDTAVKALATHSASGLFGVETGRVIGVVLASIFAALLLSAVNTAVMAMVSVMYSLGHDGELPRRLTKLNYSGVPWIGLVVACILPLAVLVFEADAKALGELYAIGVVGAIAINVVSCAANKSLAIGRWERRGLWALGALMSIIELTIVVAKPNATIFAGSVIGAVLLMRFGMRYFHGAPTPAITEREMVDWVAALERAQMPAQLPHPRVMLAARGRGQAQFAVDLAKKRGATLFVVYVRTLRLLDMAPDTIPQLKDDPEALASLGGVAVLARHHRVPMVPIYVCSANIAEEILDYTVTFGCDTLILGKTKRRAFARAVEGDVVTRVAAHLPSEVALITRDDSPHEIGEHAGPIPAPSSSPASKPDEPGSPPGL
ncbi:MAG: amino acid permease [Phycisphaerales bacterium]|nr:amino acid permease [Phycisphaerales bacterium]